MWGGENGQGIKVWYLRVRLHGSKGYPFGILEMIYKCDSKDNTNAPIMGIVVNNSNIATDVTHTEPALNTSMSINYF